MNIESNPPITLVLLRFDEIGFISSLLDQFQYIKIQPKAIELSTRPTNSVVIPQAPLAEVFSVLGLVLQHLIRNRSVTYSN